MSWRKVAVVLGVVLLLASSALAWDAKNQPPLRKYPNRGVAILLSVLKTGLGEWYNAGWGGWRNCNKKKFWLGFIPFYGTPGYLQVRSAIDAGRLRTW